MRKIVLLFALMFAVVGTVVAQQMTDDQIVQYVKDANKAGKSQQQIASELMRRGVTREQLESLYSRYQSGAYGNGQSDSQPGSRSRMRSKASDVRQERRTSADASERDKAAKRRRQIRSTENENYQSTRLQTNLDGEMNAGEDSLWMYDPYYLEGEPEADPTQQIFGHNIFTNENLTFEPNVNVATPVDYRLGPGDEVIIDVWGASETTIRETISPEGSIQVSNLGPVYLSGKTVAEANQYLKEEFAKIYSGVSGNVPNTQVKLTLGEIRSIQVNVMGEVAVPGTYTLSSFASVFHALYMAGGVNDIGSLRSIRVVRDGKVAADLDVYEFILKGRMKNDIRLQDGDVILVQPYQALVQILGKVKRPMFYELKKGETAALLLDFAGGFTGDAYKKAVRVIRKSGREMQVYNVDDQEFASFTMDDGDQVTVDSVLQRFENRVEIRGAVYRAGLYQLDGGMNTVKQLIEKAEGVRGDAFLNRAILDREHDDLEHEILQVDVKGILKGTVADIPLQKNDVLYIPSIHDLKEEATLTIHGEVANPGTYLYSSNMTIEDLVMQAGGLLETASTTKVEVARRVKDPKSSEFSTVIGQSYAFDLKDGLVVGDEDFHLQPFDEVYVRRSPAYHEQQNVMVGGEVLFSGNYALSKKNERLSDLIKKAGGVTPDAYVKGARLVRRKTEDELRREEDVLRMAKSGAGQDSIDIKNLDLSEVYSVGIDLEGALKTPGSDDDLVLREGDILYVPEYVSTVKISGAVMYPNTVTYKEGESLKYYINQAGGFGNNAKKKKAFVVYMNGTVSRLRTGNSKAIEPGCEIIVPSKDKRNKMSPAEILSIGTSTASLATMIATLVNLFK